MRRKPSAKQAFTKFVKIDVDFDELFRTHLEQAIAALQAKAEHLLAQGIRNGEIAESDCPIGAGEAMLIERDRYPKNWAVIARKTKQAANWHCQQCGKACLLPKEDWADFVVRMGWNVGDAIAYSRKPGQFLLTDAHVDQNPGNNDHQNLRAFCTVCHLRYDAPYRVANALAKRKRRGQLSLWDLTAAVLAGHGKNSKQIQLPICSEVQEKSY